MSCERSNSNLEGFKKPSRFRASPNLLEELRAEGWNIIKDEVLRLNQLGYNADIKGREDKANLHYKAANLNFYLIELGIIIRSYVERNSLVKDGCISCDASELFNLDCLDKSFMCLSKKYSTPLKNTWEAIKDFFGINTCPESTCCPGLGEMVISDPDDCNAFIIGGCSEPEIDTDEGFPFDLCGFELGGFLESEDSEIYNQCN